MPIVCDTSPCSYRLKQALPERLRPLDIVEFIHDELMDRLRFTKRPEAVAVHLTCSGRKMGLEGKLRAVAEACAETAVLPANVGCCGWAGDKGFVTPELNEHALRMLKDALPEGCTAGYSHSRTCEIGLSMHAGRTLPVDRLSGRCLHDASRPSRVKSRVKLKTMAIAPSGRLSARVPRRSLSRKQLSLMRWLVV